MNEADAPDTVRTTLVRNTFWYGLVTVFGLAAGLLMSIVLARGLGPAAMGDYSYLLWALRVLTAVAALGWTLATVRYTADAYGRGARAEARGFVAFFLRRQLATTGVVAAAVVVLALTVVDAGLRWPFVVLAVMLIPVTVEGIYTHAVYGAQRYDLTTQTSTVKMALHLTASVVAVAAGLDILGLVIGLTLGSSISCLIQRARAGALLGDVAVPPPRTMHADIRSYVASLSVVAVLDALVRDRSELFFLGLWASSEEIAFYSLAFGLATRVMVVPEIAVGALLPAFSALHGRGDGEQLRRVYATAMRYVALAGVPIAALTAALAPGLVHWLYGAAYLPTAPLLSVLVLVAVVGALRKVAFAALQAVGDRRCALTATGAAVALNVILAGALIPGHATTGAVAANSAAQLLAALWAFRGMARAHGARVPVGEIAKITVGSVPVFLVTRAVAGESHDLLRLGLAALAGVAVFLPVLVGGRLIGRREWTMLITSTRRLLAPPASGA
jgi:O-antigen/teichoic acid export membrane protein